MSAESDLARGWLNRARNDLLNADKIGTAFDLGLEVGANFFGRHQNMAGFGGRHYILLKI